MFELRGILTEQAERNEGSKRHYFRIFTAATVLTMLVGALFFRLSGRADDTSFYGALVMTGSWTLALTAASFLVPGGRGGMLTPFDKKITKGCFGTLGKKMCFLNAYYDIFRSEDYSSALEELSGLKERGLSPAEAGAAELYTAICYRRMGYSTNAAISARNAAQAQTGMPDTALLAARCYADGGLYSEAEDYYTQLMDTAEKDKIFPYVFAEAGDVYLRDGKGAAAAECYSRSISNGVSLGASTGGMVLAKILEKDIPGARDWYTAAMLTGVDDQDGFTKRLEQICSAAGISTGDITGQS